MNDRIWHGRPPVYYNLGLHVSHTTRNAWQERGVYRQASLVGQESLQELSTRTILLRCHLSVLPRRVEIGMHGDDADGNRDKRQEQGSVIAGGFHR